MFVKLHPRFESFNLQIFKIDVALEIQRVEVFDTNRRRQTIDLTQLFAGSRVVQFDARHLNESGWKARVKLLNRRADAVVGESVCDLTRNIAVDIPEPIKEEHQHKNCKNSDTND